MDTSYMGSFVGWTAAPQPLSCFFYSFTTYHFLPRVMVGFRVDRTIVIINVFSEKNSDCMSNVVVNQGGQVI